MPSDQITATTYTHLIDADEGGIRNQKEEEIETETSTPLIEDLEIMSQSRHEPEYNVLNRVVIEKATCA